MDTLCGHDLWTLCNTLSGHTHSVDTFILWTNFVDTLGMQPADTDPVSELVHTHVGHGLRTRSVDMPRGQADALCARKPWK